MFQSQTGSQALSDAARRHIAQREKDEVSIPNGKPGPLRPRLLHPIGHQTASFQSQTGSQALSDTILIAPFWRYLLVSIPNGKPGPLSRYISGTRSMGTYIVFQSQTGSQALSDRAGVAACCVIRHVSIPNGKPGPLRRRVPAQGAV